jgi:putative restriction endonuclease
LQAAHIGPYDGAATNVVTNGLLLPADLDNLFDGCLLWIDNDLVVRVAPSVTDACYRQWDGRPLRRPVDPAAQPNVEALQNHRLACRG